ncbi:MAG: arsenate reductase (glutaredoxin) [Saprospiraceae bacterium]
MTVYHNPRCAKSRNTCNLITENGASFEVVEHLKNPLTAAEISGLLKKLDMPASDLIRKGEAVYKELYKGKVLSEQEWIEAMVAHPKLIERPIVVNGNKAVIGRPPENVLALLS